MKKIGLSALISGVVLTVLLWFVRKSDWYAGELARGMSDFAELAESAFWAALVVAAFGLLLLLLSLRARDALPENEAPAPLVRSWICPACGSENTDDQRCAVCGAPRDQRRVPGWRCPFCGTENPETVKVCQSCAAPKDRPLLTWICEGCGHENPETETRCAACQRRRFSAAAGWTCPVCGMPLHRFEGEADYYCLNSECPARVVESIAHYASRDAMNIDARSAVPKTGQIVPSAPAAANREIWIIESREFWLSEVNTCVKTRKQQRLF